MSSRPPKFEFRTYPPAKVAKVANLEAEGVVPEIIFSDTVEQATQGRCIDFDYLVADSQQCQDRRTGKIPPPEQTRATWGDDLPQTDVWAEVTCFQCQHFEQNDGPNSNQGLGRCQRRRRGRYGCAKLCKLFEEK
jgi:hypothetical protein